MSPQQILVAFNIVMPISFRSNAVNAMRMRVMSYALNCNRKHYKKNLRLTLNILIEETWSDFLWMYFPFTLVANLYWNRWLSSLFSCAFLNVLTQQTIRQSPLVWPVPTNAIVLFLKNQGKGLRCEVLKVACFLPGVLTSKSTIAWVVRYGTF